MTEANYMDDCQMTSLYDAQQIEDVEQYEVIDVRRPFVGTRAECWAYRKKHGGYVRLYENS